MNPRLANPRCVKPHPWLAQAFHVDDLGDRNFQLVGLDFERLRNPWPRPMETGWNLLVMAPRVAEQAQRRHLIGRQQTHEVKIDGGESNRTDRLGAKSVVA